MEKQGPIEVSSSGSLRELFPGFYPPSQAQRQNAYRNGLISLDANALLDLYRFSSKARDEFFDVLTHVRDRLAITHQAALEFHRNRLTVVDQRINASASECAEIEKLLTRVSERVRAFSNRHQLGVGARDRLLSLVEALSRNLTDEITKVGSYDLQRSDVVAATDTVLARLENLLEGRIGIDFTDSERKVEIAEAARRREAKIPPGYEDAKKGGIEDSAGDYFVWRQLLMEAKRHGRPVLFITNETKGDWVRKLNSTDVFGPRPELVLEMLREAGVQLHTVTVVDFLKEAGVFLGAKVSNSTIREAELLPSPKEIEIRFSDTAREQVHDMNSEHRIEFASLVHYIRDRFQEGAYEVRTIFPSGRVKKRGPGVYEVKWGRNGQRVTLTMQREYGVGGVPSKLIIFVHDFTHKHDGPDTSGGDILIEA